MAREPTVLNQVLEKLTVECDSVRYGFACRPISAWPTNSDRLMAVIREEKGITVVAETAYLDEIRASYQGPFAKLSLTVETSLHLVGLTAVLARALSAAGIPANLIAGYFHDHIFVPYQDREKAMKAIEQLKQQGAAPPDQE